jgi:hypothetical protein
MMRPLEEVASGERFVEAPFESGVRHGRLTIGHKYGSGSDPGNAVEAAACSPTHFAVSAAIRRFPDLRRLRPLQVR